MFDRVMNTSLGLIGFVIECKGILIFRYCKDVFRTLSTINDESFLCEDNLRLLTI